MTDCLESQYRFSTPPAPKGYWVVGKSSFGQTRFAIYKKPNKLHRLITKLLLGWDWLGND
jgi:hypothetical protein